MKIDFVGKRYFFISVSLVLVAVSIVSILVRGFNFGLEFLGGSEIIVKTSQAMSISEIRAKVKNVAPEFEKARILETRAMLSLIHI